VPVRTAPEPAPVAVAGSGGGWRVQFGAFRDEGNAKALWARLKGQVGGLSGMQPYLRRVGPITKLQAGPVRSQADAARLCGAVKRAGSECVPVAP
jgi:cell division septation protein DedD